MTTDPEPDPSPEPDPTVGGTYTLLIDLAEPATVCFGAAGERALRAGRCAYTGSALGSGGFARVDRHYRLAAGEHDPRHWHVDYLLGHPASRLVDDVRSPGLEAECAIARSIADAASTEPVHGVGATDCNCDSHLAFAVDPEALQHAIQSAHGLDRV